MEIPLDIVEFVINKLKKLPEATIAVLKFAAGIGNLFALDTLSIVFENTPEHTMQALLLAGQKAKSATAWDAARKYFRAEQKLLL